MHPLKDWLILRRGYVFRERTSYSKRHLGLDLITDEGTPIYAPFNGHTTTLTGNEGGKTIWFYYEDKIMRFMHLSKFGKTGQVNEGDIMGFVGSTGSLSTGPHLHLDISKHRKVDINDINNFINPETFCWKKQNDNTINMEYEELKEKLRSHFVEKDVRFNFDQETGEVWIVNNKRRYKLGTRPDDIGILGAKMCKENLSPEERKYKITEDRTKVL